MEARDLLPYRTPLIGALVAATVGLTGGGVMKTGPQTETGLDSYPTRDSQYAEAEPIAWPSGEVPDYVIGTDFLQAQRMDQPPVVVAAYEVPEYLPAAGLEPEPEVRAEPARRVEAEDGAWPSTAGDILDTRLPEDLPEAPVAVAAPAALVRLY